MGDEELFGPLSPDSQRLFFLGRELKSNRSLQKLGLDRFPKNRVLHLHVKREQPKTSKSTSKKRQQRRNNKTTDTTSTLRPTRSTQPKVTVTQSSGGADVLEIHDSEDEILIEDSPRDKRRRIS